MIYQKLVPIYLYMRGFVMKFIFGRITMINFKQTYYPVNFYLPFLFTFFLEFFKLNYVYCYDNIYHYQDYVNDIKMLPPILSFNIDGKDVSNIIKNFKSNVPIVYFLHYCKLLNTKNTEIKYWADGSITDKQIKNIESYNSLNDIF